MLRFAANLTWLFQEWSFLDRFAAAADAGFTAVEYLFPYDHPPDEIARRLARHNLKQVLFNLAPGDFTAGDRGIATFPQRRDEFRTAIARGLEYARATGTPRLHLMAGKADGEGALACFRESIAFACEAAAKDGIDILIEPINTRDIPGYLMSDFRLAERLIKELNLPNFWLQFDIYHRQRLHGEVTRGLEELLPITRHMQIASAPFRREPTTGELDDRHILKIVERLGYDGYIGCEYGPADGTLKGLSWMEGL
jgi:hydroxypyruvate isomerase